MLAFTLPWVDATQQGPCGSLQPDQVGQHHDALLIEDLVVEEAMSAGKREDHCLVLCATYDGECRARGRGIGAQERDDPGNYPWSCGGASRSCSRTR